MATVAEVTTALRALDVATKVLPAEPPHTLTESINVWANPQDRYPATTVYPPSDGDGWIWGSNFQWWAPAEADAVSVAYRIVETMEQAP